MDGRPIRASKCAANGAKNTGSSSSASTRPNSAGNTNSSDGKIASHNVGWSLTVLSTMASIPSIPRVRGHPPGSAPSDPGSTRRLFQVEVASYREGLAGTGPPVNPRRAGWSPALGDLLETRDPSAPPRRRSKADSPRGQRSRARTGWRASSELSSIRCEH